MKAKSFLAILLLLAGANNQSLMLHHLFQLRHEIVGSIKGRVENRACFLKTGVKRESAGIDQAYSAFGALFVVIDDLVSYVAVVVQPSADHHRAHDNPVHYFEFTDFKGCK